ncbi:MAG: hypothetical protein ACOZQL_34710 [Myxococcota bacterium]
MRGVGDGGGHRQPRELARADPRDGRGDGRRPDVFRRDIPPALAENVTRLGVFVLPALVQLAERGGVDTLPHQGTWGDDSTVLSTSRRKV